MLFNLFFVLNSPKGKELQVVLEKLNIIKERSWSQ